MPNKIANISRIERDLAKKLPTSDPDTRAEFAAEIYKRKGFKLGDFDSVSYDDWVIRCAPGLNRPAIPPDNASPYAKAAAATALEAWYRSQGIADHQVPSQAAAITLPAREAEKPSVPKTSVGGNDHLRPFYDAIRNGASYEEAIAAQANLVPGDE